MLDTKGPEIRTGFLENEEAVMLEAGQVVTITTDYEAKGNKNLIAMSYKKLAQVHSPGQPTQPGAAAQRAQTRPASEPAGRSREPSLLCALARRRRRACSATMAPRRPARPGRRPTRPLPFSPSCSDTMAPRRPARPGRRPTRPLPFSPSCNAQDLKPGSVILCADGSISLEVISTDPAAGTVRAKALNSAKLG